MESLLKSWGMEGVSRENRVFAVWGKALGETLARHTRPVASHHGHLVIAVRDNAWMQELGFMKEEIKKKLNRALGPGAIKSIKFKIGSWEDEPQGEDAVPDACDDLDPELVEEARQTVSIISDPGLREQVLKTLLAFAKRDEK